MINVCCKQTIPVVRWLSVKFFLFNLTINHSRSNSLLLLHLFNQPKALIVMAFSTTIQPQVQAQAPSNHTTTPTDDISSALLSMIILSVYGAQASKKSLRELKRKFFWTSLKLKFQSLFKPRATVSDRTLIYILLAVALVALIVLAPVAALVLAILALILILAGDI